jgi:arylsulfatase A-like enzyme
MVLDVATGSPAVPLAWLLAFGLGAALGLAIAAALVVFARLPRVALYVIASAAGAALGYRAVDDLNAIARLDSARWLEAAGAIALSVAGGAVVTVALAVATPKKAGEKDWLRATPRRAVASGAVLFAAAIGATLFDRLAYPTSYPGAHFVARSILVVTLALGLALVWRNAWPAARWRRPAWVIAFALSALPFVVLGAAPSATSHALLSAPMSRFALELGRTAMDVDFDGYASRLGGGDCAAFDPNVHPSAKDVPGNGVDDNCLLGDAPPAEVTEPDQAPARRRGAAPPSIVLVTVDCLRPDRTGMYGADRPTTPNIDAWAQGALRFERAYTSGGWTSVALSSLMRGVWARRLRWTRLHETSRLRLMRAEDAKTLRSGEIVARTFAMPLDDEQPTLASLLHDLGYATRAVLDDGSTGYFRPALQAFDGFDTTALTDQLQKERRNDAGTTDLAIKALRALRGDKPFFLWVHYFGPHAPVQKHPEAPTFGDDVVAKFDHEVAFADREIGRLFAEIDDDPGTVVIFTADHGEEFQGRRRNHGLSLREAAIRIPLVVRAPGMQTGSCATPASLVDVAATVMAVAGAPIPSRFVGTDLRALCSGDDPSRVLFFDTWRFDHRGRVFFDAMGATDGSRKVTRSLLDADVATWDLHGFEETYSRDAAAFEPLREALEQELERTGVVRLHD